MKTFKDYLNESQNLHLEHLESLVFNLGVVGTRKAIYFLRDLRDMLSAGNRNKTTPVTVKWDGAPAVFIGIDPTTEKFFVAKKSIFNTTPKVYYSIKDIEQDTSGDLAEKLKAVFNQGKLLGLKSGVYQGDLLFTSKDIRKQNIDGEMCYAFQPNTIVYAVPVSSSIGMKIRQASVGVVWHTTYTGNSLSNLNASFGKNITNNFKQITSMFNVDATFEDVAGAATFTESERMHIDNLLSMIGRQFKKIKAPLINSINKNTDILNIINIFINSQIRINRSIDDPVKYTDDLYTFIVERFAKEAEKRKTAAGKQTQYEKRDSMLMFFAKEPKQEFVNIFTLVKLITEAKEFIISKLNRASNIKTLIKTPTGFRVTSPEGYVAISGDDAVKLVSRLEFSRANFSTDIIKGWQK